MFPLRPGSVNSPNALYNILSSFITFHRWRPFYTQDGVCSLEAGKGELRDLDSHMWDFGKVYVYWFEFLVD